ncbi:hypothetical protein PHMEG_00018508 [Phytophthora megakarya]|uniref:HAT C-terminal dimerisation domain-containing protein n=1 Tax=Phytophthora megakarya TaxID=4795 RepID=A0A225VWF1_9STRA|nr:hypothetical protein PHMEG_00018508 [Phytophthora megakarya]
MERTVRILAITIDILKWYKEHGECEFPTTAILARIYLGKPMSTAVQERLFSLGKYIVNDVRTSLDDERAEMVCLMKAN